MTDLLMPDGFFNDRLLGVTEGFLAGGRRYFGKAASGLGNQLVDPRFAEYSIDPKAVKAGIKGEESTSLVLRKWMRDKPNVVLVDSVHLRTEAGGEVFCEEEKCVNVPGDTDHVLIVADKVFVIDSKNWRERASYSVCEDGLVLRGKNEFAGSRVKAREARFLWENYFKSSGRDLSFECFVCISNPNSFIVRDRAWWKPGFKLVNQDTLVYFLDMIYDRELAGKDFVYVDVVAMVLAGLQKPYNALKEKFPQMYARFGV